MAELGLLIFIHVDDCFWVTPSYTSDTAPNATWVLRVFEYVTDHLLGWRLDPSKSAVGATITLLGRQVAMDNDTLYWQMSEDKAAQRCAEIAGLLEQDYLRPSGASKLAGRLAFMNTRVYSRLARALLTLIIWLQVQQVGGYQLTRRLRWSLIWFHEALSSRWDS